MSWREKVWLVGCLLLVAGATAYAGCGDSDGVDADKSTGGDSKDDNGSGDDDEQTPSRLDAGTSSRSSGEGALPSETEEQLAFDVPRAGATSVYVPNPLTNRVAVVNANTITVDEDLTVGSQPTFAATVPGQDIALVLNVGSRDAALLRTEAGKTSLRTLPVGHDANAIAIAPDGVHAVIYLDTRQATNGAQSFQDLTVVDLTKGSESARRASVGFRPRAVQFSSDGKQAFVITEDGISVLDLATLAHRLVGVGDQLGDPESVDVQVTPDGAFALARREQENTLRLIHLADGSIQTLSLAALTLPTSTADAGVADAGADAGASDAGVTSGEPELTDLDLAPDGSFAIAVLRDRGALVRIPLPQGFSDPSAIRVRVVEEQLIGSVTLSKSGKTAVAYTTAAPIEGVVVIDDLEGSAPARGVRLRKAVRAVALSDDGKHALVLHSTVGNAQSAADEDARIDASEGYSVVDLASGFSKLQLTSARVNESGLVITPDGTHVFALLRSDTKAVRALNVIDLGSFQVTNVDLQAPPTSIGFLPLGLGRVFVGHAAEGGMISFFDGATGAALGRVAGYEIASRIRR